MKAHELLKKLGNKLLGKKANASTAEEQTDGVETFAPVSPNETMPQMPILDGLGVIQLHEYWRN